MILTRNRRERIASRLSFIGAEVMTKQCFKDECDINNIMAKYKRTGVLDHLAGQLPTYGDFDSEATYQQALNQVIAAQESFDALPAHIRDRMNNDPGTLMAFMANADNQAEAERLGLVRKRTDPVLPPSERPAPQGGTASGGGETPPTPPSTANPNTGVQPPTNS